MVGQGSFALGGMVLIAASGVPGLFCDRRGAWGQWCAALLFVAGGLLAGAGTWEAFRGATVEIARCPTPIPGGEFVLAADALSAFFLAPIVLVAVLGSIYGLEYWRQADHPLDGRKLRLFYGLLAASLAVLVLARNSVTFLAGWEAMAVSAFFLVGAEDQQDDVREAAWHYLAASHAATLSLFAMFALLYGATGSYDLVPLSAESISPRMAAVLFVLGLMGFGLKAGLMPLHFWLPSAHAMAPSHVSALMSGVLIKTGIYGLVRLTWVLPPPPLWWGELMLALGAVSAVLGVAFALGQHDLKRLLAYHSIENIGIIVIGLALALIGQSLEQPLWIVLGLSGSLLHVWNHALFKSLLFLSAGSVIHARHTREIDRLGGLAKSMPWTAGCFLIGATAICGLPPLNGFISEFLIYTGLFHTLGLGEERAFPIASFVAPVLALMGALAVACFVKVFGVVFLGVDRTPSTPPAHESGWLMRGPMCVLAACCAAIGLAPTLVAPLLDRVVGVWTHQPAPSVGGLQHAAPLAELSLAALGLAAALLLGMALLNWRIRTQPLTWTETWGCGYTGPTPRMQYTASSLAEFLVSLLGWVLRPTVHRPHIDGLFPQPAEFESHVPEVVLDRAILPAFDRLGRALFWLRLVQLGSVQIYLLYIFAMLAVLLVFSR
jgi:hydrogenase-4 component B